MINHCNCDFQHFFYFLIGMGGGPFHSPPPMMDNPNDVILMFFSYDEHLVGVSSRCTFFSSYLKQEQHFEPLQAN